MLELTSNNKEELKNKKLVFVDFWASWCGPCMVFSPTFQAVALKYQDKAEFMKCDVDQEQDLAVEYGVMSIPSVLVYSYGKLVDKFVGLTNENVFSSFVEKNLNR